MENRKLAPEELTEPAKFIINTSFATYNTHSALAPTISIHNEVKPRKIGHFKLISEQLRGLSRYA